MTNLLLFSALPWTLPCLDRPAASPGALSMLLKLDSAVQRFRAWINPSMTMVATFMSRCFEDNEIRSAAFRHNQTCHRPRGLVESEGNGRKVKKVGYSGRGIPDGHVLGAAAAQRRTCPSKRRPGLPNRPGRISERHAPSRSRTWTNAGVTRKLAVILAADVAGYSRLMAADEEGTLAALNARRQVIDELIAAAPRPDLQHRRRQRHRRVRERGRGGALRRRDPAGARAPQRRPPGAAPHAVSGRRQPRRRHGRRRRSVRRRRQCRGAPGRRGGARRHLHLGRGLRPDPQQGRSQLRRSRRAIAQEHRLPGARVRRAAGSGRRRVRRGAAGGDCAEPGIRLAVDRRAALREPGRRSRAGVFRRRHHRGPDHRAVALPGAARDRAQLGA